MDTYEVLIEQVFKPNKPTRKSLTEKGKSTMPPSSSKKTLKEKIFQPKRTTKKSSTTLARLEYEDEEEVKFNPILLNAEAERKWDSNLHMGLIV